MAKFPGAAFGKGSRHFLASNVQKIQAFRDSVLEMALKAQKETPIGPLDPISVGTLQLTGRSMKSANERGLGDYLIKRASELFQETLRNLAADKGAKVEVEFDTAGQRQKELWFVHKGSKTGELVTIMNEAVRQVSQKLSLEMPFEVGITGGASTVP